MEKKNKRVFISLPMSGYTELEISENIRNARIEYLNRTKSSYENIWFIDNFSVFGDPLPNTAKTEPLWYLGRAIRKMSSVDEVFFYGNWKEARGCRIEHEICEVYGIPYMEV